ncbi:hypothetical protein CANMA_003980 [Candida margitis]|uniref:uncharacterized protein n=1 Tax=Candida margitis TaxID=1775924 RepID=UPI002227621E|nr:uncharacterized protein CANMA_003980 [Candida margitis]KAI5960718.1 hypothetical protein CANMA_003980 [Candida margitis]
MTQIVVSPSLLPELLPSASDRSPKHIRLFCQIVNYDPSTFILSVGKIPTLSNIDTHIFEINIRAILSNMQSSLNFEKGNVIEIDGHFDGKKVDPMSICDMNWSDVTIEKLRVLEYMSEMKIM